MPTTPIDPASAASRPGPAANAPASPMAAARSLALPLILALALVLSISTLPARTARAQDEVREIVAPQPVPPDKPRGASGYVVEAVELIVDIDGQRASALLRHTVRNTGSAPLELDYLAPLPLGGEVAGVTLLRDGQELPGDIHDRDEAFRIYQEIVSRLKDPALIEYAGRGLYRARVFPLEPGRPATLELRLEWLPPKDQGRVDVVFPLAGPLTAGRIVGRQEASVTIRGEGVSGLYSPLEGVQTSVSGGAARASLKISDSKAIPSLQLHYQLDPGPVGGLVLSHKPDPKDDGYLLFLAEPSASVETAALPKTVVLVLDRSGSMIGEKFEQAKEALRFVLERLSDDDAFNLVDFANEVRSFQPEPAAYGPESLREALEYLDNLRAGGNTHLSGAIETASRQTTPGRPTYVLLLTDGQPTRGLLDEGELLKATEAANPEGAARIMTFGVGHDVNARLLSRLSERAGGVATFVEPSESIEAKVSSLFTKITSPVLTSPRLGLSTPVNRLIPAEPPDLFAGSQMVVVGRYPRGGPATATLEGGLHDGKATLTYRTTLATGPVEGGDFLARLWAERRVGQLVDELDRLGGPAPDSVEGGELVKEIVDLAKRHGILTPYTSFLALENKSLTDSEEVLRQAGRNLSSLGEVAGASANRQRQWRATISGGLDSAQAPKAAPMSQEAIVELKADFAATDSALAESEAELIPPRNLAGRAFFLKNGRLTEGDLTEEELAGLKPIGQLDEEYFRLAAELGPLEAVLLAQPEPIVFRHRGRVVLIEPVVL